MPYQVVVPKRVQREIDSLPTTVRSRVVQVLARLQDEPRPTGCIKLTGYHHEYRIRVGEYRIRYEVRDADQSVFVLRVQHRRDVYRP
jgi:mRNA interferase RelE/StbE